MRDCPSAPGGVCWDSVSNPTAWHAAETERLRRLAQEHRAAAEALRTAEERACDGIPVADRDESPFAHRGDILQVEPLYRTTAGAARSLAGARVVFRRVPGMTVEWLRVLVDCHLARNVAAGHEMPEMPNCPLVPKGVSAHVESVPSGFAVSVSVADEATAKEVLRRAQAPSASPDAQ
ncbi:MAG: hypothetical protein IPI67_23865 [Myxococcales bacterium]|nr:hypothetical protein [Myxococcales bacterium]